MGKSKSRRDAEHDSGSGDDKCKHPAPWDSCGPTTDNTGRSCVLYNCSECGKYMNTYYYPKKD